MADNVAVIAEACRRCDVVLMTGGLGPTLDDITREAVAAVLGVSMELDEDALAQLKTFFQGRGREMPERNVSQAMRPVGTEMLANPVGTAPGVFARVPRDGRPDALLAVMPGVPSEMHRMFRDEVTPRLPGGRKSQCLRLLHCYGIGESAAEEMLGELTARGRNPEVGITASSATITLRILASADTPAEAESMALAAEADARGKLGRVVFGTAEDTLESVVLDRLAAAGQTMAVGEVGTGGVIAQRLATVPDAERAFRGGLTVPHNRSDELLGLPAGPPFDAVTPEHAAAVAEHLRTRLAVDYAVAVVADPAAMTASVTPGDASAYVAACGEGWSRTGEVRLLGNPAIHHVRCAKTALNLLRMKLQPNDFA